MYMKTNNILFYYKKNFWYISFCMIKGIHVLINLIKKCIYFLASVIRVIILECNYLHRALINSIVFHCVSHRKLYDFNNLLGRMCPNY